MKFYYLILVILFLSGFSCKEGIGEAQEPSKKKNIVSIADTLSLKFNANDKWSVNIETHEGVNKMDSIIKQFEITGNKSYKELGDALSKQTSYIIRNCTMTGESHDQLHIVLVPMLDEISVLRETENEAESKKAFNNLKELIKAYFEYFKM